jgi:arylsulfatase
MPSPTPDKVPQTIPFLMAIDETFDVGIDLRTPIDDRDCQIPFGFTSKLAKLIIKVGPERLMAEDCAVKERVLVRAND